MTNENSPQLFEDATGLAQEVIEAALHNNLVLAQELLLRLRNELRRQSGDLPILVHEQHDNGSSGNGKAFVTRSFAETRAWGWLELASGIVQLTIERPGSGMMYCSRCWRIWRAADGNPGNPEQSEQRQPEEAIRERIRARLWLGEAWARFLSDRAERSANAILRAALSEIQRVNAQSLLQETIAQQSLLPPAQVGSPAYQADKQTTPYITVILSRTGR